MSFILKFDEDERKAFSRGLLKGMAAPLMLFANSPAPALPRFDEVALPRPANTKNAPLTGDWVRVGRDVRTVVRRHDGEK
jgi:hypothetical protein